MYNIKVNNAAKVCLDHATNLRLTVTGCQLTLKLISIYNPVIMHITNLEL